MVEVRPVYRCTVCGMFIEENKHCGAPATLVLDSEKRVRLSKLLSYILRHDPESVGLELDNEGWVRIETLVEAIKTKWRYKELYSWLQPLHVVAVAVTDPKGRFELRNGMIRACYGHNKRLRISITYPEERSLKILYHGTSMDRIERILREGIKPMNRHYVHLTSSVNEACIVGSRHSKHRPVALVIDADCVRRYRKIYRASHKVFLTKFVEPKCIIDIVMCNEISS